MTDNKKLIKEARTFVDSGWFRVDYPTPARPTPSCRWSGNRSSTSRQAA